MLTETGIAAHVRCWNCAVEYDRRLAMCPRPFGCGAPRVRLMDEIAACFDAVDYLVRALHRLRSVAKRDGHERVIGHVGNAILTAAGVKGCIDLVLAALRAELEGK